MKHNLILLLLFLTAIIGCRRLERPDGLPELYPCTITTTFDGEAVEGVNIQLTPVMSDSKWAAGGKTDAKGVAVLATAVGFNGVPEGEYIVSFTKTEQRGGETVAEMTPKSLIPLKYAPGYTMESVEIKPETNEFTFSLDAGEEIAPPRRGVRDRPGPRF
jgi:hypothetical protein